MRQSHPLADEFEGRDPFQAQRFALFNRSSCKNRIPFSSQVIVVSPAAPSRANLPGADTAASSHVREPRLIFAIGRARAVFFPRNVRTWWWWPPREVGGIKANNDFPVEFLLDNLTIQNNLIEAGPRF
jgi:hypothetical protein